MNLHEYQAKQLFREYDISVSEGLSASSSQEAEKIALSLNVDKWVVKAQVHAGGRGKSGGVELVDGIEKVKLLKPRRFKWKDNLDLGICDGFFAHEIEEAIPTSQAIVGTKDAVATESDINVGFAKSIGEPIYQQVDQSKLIPILTAALKEAITKIETLETKVAALEAG